MASSSADKAPSKILIALDYGTTFSGCSFGQTARPEARSIITQWSDVPGSLEGVTMEKVPTKINYDDFGNVKHWGYQVGETEGHFKEFKLGLSKRKVKDSHVEKRYPDPVGLRPNAKYSAKRLSTDYLRKLREHALEIIKLKLGSPVVDNTPIEYTLTVPAIWGESEKAATLEVAKDAGFGGDIVLVSEPDAAMIYTLDTMDPKVFSVGDTYIMCDAGGGTVDLISYVIKSLKPLDTSEDVIGDGHKCGSAILNRVFAEHIRETLSDLDGWDDDTLDEALERFENSTKRNFGGSEDTVLIPVPGLTNNKSKGVMRGKLTMSGTTLRKIFEPCISEITALVTAQEEQTTGTVKSVLLVGGFGQNPYLREMIKEVMGQGIAVLQPPKGWTAVVEGALIKALSDDTPDLARLKISGRKARKYYGITVSVPFVHNIHQKRRKYFDQYEGVHRIDTVDWVIKKGDELREDKPVMIKYFHSWPVYEKNPTFCVDIFAFESEVGRQPPLYDDQGARRLASLSVNLGSIPRGRLRSHYGADGKMHYRIDIQVQAKFESASISYSLWYAGTCYGSVEAKYD